MIKKAFYLFIFLNLLFFNSKVLLANSWMNGYEPQKEENEEKGTYQKRSTSSGGSRSSCSDPLKGKQVTLDVPPESIVHSTNESNPTFSFSSEGTSEIPLIFTLVDPEIINPLVEKQIKIDFPGSYKISIPEYINLEKNKIYTWYIAIPCENKPGDFREVLQASLEYIEDKINPHVQKVELDNINVTTHQKEFTSPKLFNSKKSY